MSGKGKVLLISLVTLFILSCGLLVYTFRSKLTKVTDSIFNRKSQEVVVADSINVNLNENTNDILENVDTNISISKSFSYLADKDVTWQSPELIADLKLVKDFSDSADAPKTTYYKIATLSDGGELILADYPPEGPSFSKSFLRFIKTANNRFFYLKKYSDDLGYSDMSTIINDYGITVTLDTTTMYSQISSPDLIKTESGITLIKSGGDFFFSDVKADKLVAKSEYGDIYRAVDNSTNKSIAMRSLYLKHADGTVTAYSEKMDFMSTARVPDLTLANGQKSDKKYVPNFISSCGSTSDSSIITGNYSDKTAVVFGTLSTGEKVYTLKNDQDQIVKDIYENYKIGRGENLISISTFAKEGHFFIWKDAFSNYIVFVEEDFIPQAECGKPVIYLYPENTTEISVKVDADITESNPIYSNGWKAIAEPNGQLTVSGKPYPYLFWEGKGKSYPTIRTGFVVKNEEIKTVLTDHLSRLGLNQKESADFLEFWLPKMPNKPYIRLTWLGTKEMNGLAPLEVMPKPETMIRIFLDFEGLDKRVDIMPQTLSAPKRVGFTLVEWGGLLVK